MANIWCTARFNYKYYKISLNAPFCLRYLKTMTHSEIETRGIPTGNGSRPRIQAAIDAQCHTIFVRNACIGCIQRCPLRQVVDVANRYLVCSTLVCIVAGNMAVGDRDISGAQGDARTERVVGCLRATRQCGNGQTGLVNTPLAHDLGNPEVVGSPQIGLRVVIGRSILGALRRFVWKPTSIIGPDSRAVWTVMGGCRERWS